KAGDLGVGQVEAELLEQFGRLGGRLDRGQTRDGAVLQRKIPRKPGKSLHRNVVGLEQLALALVAPRRCQPVAGGSRTGAAAGRGLHSPDPEAAKAGTLAEIAARGNSRRCFSLPWHSRRASFETR